MRNTKNNICPYFYEYEEWPINIGMCMKAEIEINRMRKCLYKFEPWRYLHCSIYNNKEER